MFCKNCGQEMRDGAEFCSSCGTLVHTADAVATAKKTRGQKSGMFVWAIAAFLAITAIVLTLAFFVFPSILTVDTTDTPSVSSTDVRDDEIENDTPPPLMSAEDTVVAPAILESDDTTLQLAFCLPTFEVSYFAAMKEAVESEFPRDGIKVTFYDAEYDQTKQNNDIKNIILAGMDGIVLVPVDTEAAIPAVSMANESGIPVVTLDRTIPEGSADVASFVTYDNYDMGNQAATVLISALSEKYPDDDVWNVVVIEGSPEFQASTDRAAGIADVFADNDRINVLASLNGEYSSDMAQKVAYATINAFPELQAIICHSDLMAEGCYQAAVQHVVAGDFIIIGMEGLESVVHKITDGTINGTVLINPRLMAVNSVDALADLILGKEVPSTIVVPTTTVDAANAQEILNDHLAW